MAQDYNNHSKSIEAPRKLYAREDINEDNTQEITSTASGDKRGLDVKILGDLKPLVDFDYIDNDITSSDRDVISVKLGGAGGTDVLIIRIFYTDITKKFIDYVTYEN